MAVVVSAPGPRSCGRRRRRRPSTPARRRDDDGHRSDHPRRPLDRRTSWRQTFGRRTRPSPTHPRGRGPLRSRRRPHSCRGRSSRRWAEARVVPMAPAVVATAWLTALARHDWTSVVVDHRPEPAPGARPAVAGGPGSHRRQRHGLVAGRRDPPHRHVGPLRRAGLRPWSQLFAPPSSRTGDGPRVQGPPDRHQFGVVGRSSRADVGRELCMVEATVGPTAGSPPGADPAAARPLAHRRPRTGRAATGLARPLDRPGGR